MGRKTETFKTILFGLCYSAIANLFYIIRDIPLLYMLLVLAALAINVFAGFGRSDIKSRRLKICNHGTNCLVIFCISLAFSAAWHIYLAFVLLPNNYVTFLISAGICAAFEAVVFWNGIVSVYLTSVQLGVKTRVIGVICGLIVPVDLVVLIYIITVCRREVEFETKKNAQNEARKDMRICETKYPILLVHGIFFRDSKLINYWGRIPGELKRNGATVYYGNHESAASVEYCAGKLKERIEQICRGLGCEKVNIIAHSKGGLDCRRAIAEGAAEHVASLTTVNTPHRGCAYVDYLLTKVPQKIVKKVECGYNLAAEKLGDDEPDFMAAVTDLRADVCKEFDAKYGVPDGIFTQSFGSKQRNASAGRFPLNLTYRLAKRFGGDNDGLVAADSFEWGDNYTYITPAGRRGVTHGDMIDLNRENIKGFDVREFYVSLVADLKNRGL